MPGRATDSRPTLIIPVESQVRELDAKLLLACFAAERGYSVLVGSRAYMHFAIGPMPRGVYFAKSMRRMSDLMFGIIRHLGHAIVAWEEEALVHPPAEVFFSLRMSPGTLRHIAHMFAWGEDNVALLRQYPAWPASLPIHVTGNPRGDMLRSEIRPYFESDVRRLQAEHGQFVLINTNFTDVNPYLPGIGLFVPGTEPGKPPRLGQAGQGMPLDFALGLRDHKHAILAAFLAMIPDLAAALPDRTVVVRPHPSEQHQIYHDVAARCPNVVVSHQGNVLPWLLASRMLIHNGCTTAAEAYAMGVPTLSFMPLVNDLYDYDFQGMPNRLSLRCFSQGELLATAREILAGPREAVADAKRDQLFAHYLSARTGKFACDRILDVLDASGYRQGVPGGRSTGAYALARAMAAVKAGLTQLNMRRPGRNRQAYHDHRFPRLAVADVEQRVERFGRVLHRFATVRVSPYAEHIFRIDA